MSINRVQKLLFSEYCDFEDMVLIESPFAQTTREGKGVRQVHLGLTPSKLVLATDIIPPVEKSSFDYIPGIDPDIETFELIAIYPVECINLSIFHRRKRQVLKAHLCNNRKLYFELGGFENRRMFWNLWCEKVKFLCPDNSGSSHSEPSVTSSSTPSTLYLVESKEVRKPNGYKQIWCKFASTAGKHDLTRTHKWTDRCLFMGRNYEDFPELYKPIMLFPAASQFLEQKQISNLSMSTPALGFGANMRQRQCVRCDSSISHINRFRQGVEEKCHTGLFLPAEDFLMSKRFSLSDPESSVMIRPTKSSLTSTDIINIIMEDSVKIWETQTIIKADRCRHRRRYGFAPQPLFLNGLGPWNVTPGGRYSIQVKRAVSSVRIKRSPIEPEFRLHVSKRQLVATVSCDHLDFDTESNLKENQLSTISCSPKKPVIFFWTPDFWYRPMSARDAYLELQKHLQKLREFRAKKTKTKRRFFRRKADIYTESETEEVENTPKTKTNKSVFRVFGSKQQQCCDTQTQRKGKESSVEFLKRILHTDSNLSAWDFDSITLAQQLTMIDKDLFLKITPMELKVLIYQQSVKNAPNIAALIAFAHRITCLVTSDVLNNESEKSRARLISRFINVAYKCHKIANFHSCRTILFGLQSPAVFRLKHTWAYVRKKHSTKYLIFEFLSRLYRDPRLLLYQKVFFLSIQSSPFLPYIGDLVAKLLDRIPDYNFKNMKKRLTTRKSNEIVRKKQSPILSQLLKSIKLLHFDKEFGATYRGLCQYFKPLNHFEDNRKKCLKETIELLQQSQLSALQFSFSVNEQAMDYLLKARYREEKDNFFVSLKVVEPSVVFR